MYFVFTFLKSRSSKNSLTFSSDLDGIYAHYADKNTTKIDIDLEDYSPIGVKDGNLWLADTSGIAQHGVSVLNLKNKKISQVNPADCHSVLSSMNSLNAFSVFLFEYTRAILPFSISSLEKKELLSKKLCPKTFLNDFYGNITLENSRIGVQYHKTGDVHIAIYDYKARSMLLSIGRVNKHGDYQPLEGEGSDNQDYWMAYNRPYVKFMLDDLYSGI